MSSGANNVKISPVNVRWQIEASEIIDFTGLTGFDVKGNSFNISTAKDLILNYIWGDDSVEADPAVVGRVGVPFTVVGDTDTATVLAVSCAAALDALPGYNATAAAGIVTVVRADVGLVTAAADTDMGVAFTVCREGKDFDLGLLDGDVEFSVTPAMFDVTAHQTGVTKRAALFQGVEEISASTTMLETDISSLEEIYSLYGGSYTPGAGTKIFGIGTNKIGQNLLIGAARLVMRPTAAVDNTLDSVIMLAVPVPSSLVFSGENPRTLSVDWTGYVDDTYASDVVNTVAFGDVFQ